MGLLAGGGEIGEVRDWMGCRWGEVGGGFVEIWGRARLVPKGLLLCWRCGRGGGVAAALTRLEAGKVALDEARLPWRWYGVGSGSFEIGMQRGCLGWGG